MQHAIALLGDERVVRDDDADLVFADLLQGFKHALCGGFIEVRGGLIEHEDRAVIVENARQRDLAALTAGEIFALWLDLKLLIGFYTPTGGEVELKIGNKTVHGAEIRNYLSYGAFAAAVFAGERDDLARVHLRFGVGQDDFFFVIRNGSGKSTLTKLLIGFYTPTGGEVELKIGPAFRRGTG